MEDEIFLLDYVELLQSRGAYEVGDILQVIQVVERNITYVLKGDDEPITINVMNEPGVIIRTEIEE